MARNVAADYRRGELGDFIRLGPGDLAAAQAEARPDVDREALASALRAYHVGLGTLDAHTEAALARLAHPASRVVVTGQQAGLLSGPAYSVHKAADAALLAQALSTEDVPVVAVFWVASQDHDAAEVASTTLLDRSERLHRLSLDLPGGVPVGRIPWKEEWTAQVRGLLHAFDAPAEHKAAVLAQVERALRPGGSYADVFARLIHSLLAQAGLLVLDPLHPALARLMVPALARELSDPLASSERIEDAAARLAQAGYVPQLRRPAGATNLFLEEDDGQRRLLRFDGKAFQTSTQTYTRADLLARLEADPSRLTPAAGLRPAVQDTLLPTLAFVVGPGEIAYGAELREVYPLHGLQQPLLWPRLSVTWLEPNVARLLRRLGASAAEVQRDPEGVLGRALAAERRAGALSLRRLEDLEGQLRALTGELGALDPTLEGAAERTRRRTVARVAHLQTLAARALARAEDERGGQLTRLKQHLLPLGIPQERELNFLTFLLKHGDTPLRQLLALPPGFVGEVEIP
ncbi:bacillithiol biosynthesis cysteine-adding enzyme BshC [Deinococcus reticulitermitis]|uniref:Putative cysteine ligase BshC n=1 Tax=Deinococcus reticulitermitis TaxID=856736 RepID=A0A1H6SHV3_9DEIO|nr:bacillithiol biosynthesis cysteine-adding enzyme BshC [Deinococcus reticulitermitis]SEI65464.1 bacillithiol biosynthesis cysteine-adding enzyme BshC [Deinococcus reticulitermitis]